MLWTTTAIFAFGSLLYGYHWLMSPHVNPNPTKKVVVRGNFPYDRGLDLEIKMSFYTKNPRCDVTARAFLIFPAAEVSREQWVDIPVVREGGNRYSFTYYEDHFLSGFCDWDQRFVYTHLFLDGEWQPGNEAILGLNREYNRINYECYYKDMLTPGLGKDAREKSIICFDNLGRDNSFDSHLTDNEVNFVWNRKIRYDYYGPTGRIESTWNEGEGK